MSIVCYHARVDEIMLDALQADPDLFWKLPQIADTAGAQLLFTDKDWSALCWLLSPKAREEQKHLVVEFTVNFDRTDEDRCGGHAGWEAAKAREAAKRGVQLVETESMPDEPALTAIHGRGPRDSRFEQIGFGARTFVPAEVADLSAALDRITDADLREHFDPEVMESLDVAGIRWTEEEPDVLDAILIPVFDRIRIFYRLASQARQHVLAVIT